ncbi:hypothetical protein NE237_017311 [Protea cynaroides]|uniref:Uncharacterized protein n=1 Tax=Protea cynaroides TaxID=273540 RepID=A0A9Q0K7T1_9MAGN|nr:hypothetical protein NE237_017311 [Protea cynaroides]
MGITLTCIKNSNTGFIVSQLTSSPSYHLLNSTLRIYGPFQMLTRTRVLATPILRQEYSQHPGNPDFGTGNPVTDEDKISLLPVPLGLGPQDYPDGCLIKERAPVKKGDRYALTTSGQPFVLNPHSSGLLQYGTISLSYLFSVDGENNEELGLPSHVFRQKFPEWTPVVQFYSSKEYPRLTYALNYNKRILSFACL